jgi:hypothetical protein
MDMELGEWTSRRSRPTKSKMVLIRRGDEFHQGGVGQPSREGYQYDQEMNSVKKGIGQPSREGYQYDEEMNSVKKGIGQPSQE